MTDAERAEAVEVMCVSLLGKEFGDGMVYSPRMMGEPAWRKEMKRVLSDLLGAGFTVKKESGNG